MSRDQEENTDSFKEVYNILECNFKEMEALL